MRMLGELYQSGRGTPKDLATAYFWLYLAQIGNDTQAVEACKTLEAQLSTEELNATRERVKVWLEKHQGRR